MNKIFHPCLDKFMIVYLDVIVTYSNTLEEYVDNLKKVYQVLWANVVYIKKEKYDIAQLKVHFLGHAINNSEPHLNEAKV